MAERKSNNKNNKKKRFNGNSDEEFVDKFPKKEITEKDLEIKTKKKVCTMCANKESVLDYKNYDQMKKFVNEKGKILPRRATGACAKHQREITQAVKRARHIAILPYTQG